MPSSERTVGGDLLVEEVEATGQRRPADAGPEEGPAVVAGQAVGREVGGEHRLVRGEAQVAGCGQAAAGADGRTADHGDGRLRHQVEQHGGVLVVAGQVADSASSGTPFSPPGPSGAVLDVTARAEPPCAALGRGAGEDDHLHFAGLSAICTHGVVECPMSSPFSALRRSGRFRVIVPTRPVTSRRITGCSSACPSQHAGAPSSRPPAGLAVVSSASRPVCFRSDGVIQCTENGRRSQPGWAWETGRRHTDRARRWSAAYASPPIGRARRS